MTRRRANWTDDMVARARKMRAAGAIWWEIDDALGVRKGSSCNKISSLDASPERKERARQAARDRSRAWWKRHHPISMKHQAEGAVDVPDDVIADRDQRLNAPRTLTAELMGDPPPGRSALAQKQDGIA